MQFVLFLMVPSGTLFLRTDTYGPTFERDDNVTADFSPVFSGLPSRFFLLFFPPSNRFDDRARLFPERSSI